METVNIDDLILEYMITKVKNGFEPQFTVKEFTDFLVFFERQMPIKGVISDKEENLRKFLSKKYSTDWSRIRNPKTKKEIMYPHMTMTYENELQEFVVNANYKLGDFDLNIINSHYKDDNKAFKIRKIISVWLNQYPQRTIDENIELDEYETEIGKNLAAKIILNIWDQYVDELIMEHKWPKQCKDINKYLFETDLAVIIGVNPIKRDLIEIYNVFSKRISVMYHNDINLKISSKTDGYLARANYELLIRGYEKIINSYFEHKEKTLDIDLTSFTYLVIQNKDEKPVWGENMNFSVSTKEPQSDIVEKVLEYMKK